MSQRSIVIRHHHNDPALVLLDTPPELAAVMGRYQPARYVGARGGAYALPADQLDTLATFAAAHSITVIDGRRGTGGGGTTPVVGPARPLPECAECGQPAARDAQPQRCPACGAAWRAIVPTGQAQDVPTITCSACSLTQRAGFTYCGRCGKSIQDTPQPLAEPAAHGRRAQGLLTTDATNPTADATSS